MLSSQLPSIPYNTNIPILGSSHASASLSVSSPLPPPPMTIAPTHSTSTISNTNNNTPRPGSSSSSSSTNTSHTNNIHNNSASSQQHNQIKSSPNTVLTSTHHKNLDNVTINVGSRRSKLAIAQGEIVCNEILKHFPNFKTKITAVTTLGDQVQNKPLYSFGGKSLWTKELEMLLYEKIGTFDKIDLIVHSLKDMPTNLPEGFELGCILNREDPRDAVCFPINSPYKTLAELPIGSVVGTSSVRRSAQLLKKYPHLKFQSVRGSIDTRLNKLDVPDTPYAALLLAAAGLIRVNLGYRISQLLDEDIMYHAVGQGALGVEIRAKDPLIKQICNIIRDNNSMYCCLAERAMLRYLEGGCSVPIGCTTNYNEKTQLLKMKAIVVSVDGTQSVEQMLESRVTNDEEAEALGTSIGELFIQNGAKKILDEIDYDRINEIKQDGLSSDALMNLNN